MSAFATYSGGVLFLARTQIVLDRYRRRWESSRQWARTPALRDEVDARLIGLMMLCLSAILSIGVIG